MGEAIEIMLNFAIQIGINSPRIIEVDTFKFKNLPKENIKSQKLNSYYLNERYYFPLCDYSKFQLPFGVVLSGAKGEFEPELISEGFTRYADDDGIEHLEVVVDRTRLLDTYLSVLERLKSIRVFWIRLAYLIIWWLTAPCIYKYNSPIFTIINIDSFSKKLNCYTITVPLYGILKGYIKYK